MSTKAPSMVWDNAADRKMLLFIVRNYAVNYDVKAVAQHMSGNGITLTENAIRKRFSKFKVIDADPSTPPSKAKSTAKSKSTGKGKTGVKRKHASDDEEEEEVANEANGSLSPRRSTRSPKTPKFAVKQEEDGSGGESEDKTEGEPDDEIQDEDYQQE